jgi:hypothetical protein
LVNEGHGGRLAFPSWGHGYTRFAELGTRPSLHLGGPRATTAVEIAGLGSVAASGSAKPFYGEETLGDGKYFTAVYADKAIAQACIDCHNAHRDSRAKTLPSAM